MIKKKKKRMKLKMWSIRNDGHQRITSATEDRRITTTRKRNRLLTAPEITNSMNNS